MSEPVLGSGADGAAPTGDDVVVPAAATPRPVPGPGPAAPGGSAVPQAAQHVPSPCSPGAGGDAPATGDAAVDEALRTLLGVEHGDLRAQVTAFEEVHRALQDRLADAEG